MKGNLTQISVISTAEGALRRLKKAGIRVFDCEKRGAEFSFWVKDKDSEKVFAIFSKPCYNIKVVRKSRKNRLISTLFLRAGLIAGAVLFVILAAISDTFVLKIKVSGSGNYLEPEIRRIVYDEGAREFSSYKSFNKSVATGRILALPQVTFCNIEHRGSVLIVDVQVNEENSLSVLRQPLKADRDGVVRSIVAICGTAAVAVGDGVKAGDVLIYAHTISGEETTECLAAGYCELECKSTAIYFAECESEENLSLAYSSALLEEREILTRSHRVEQTDGGVNYVIDFTYLHKLSINLS